MTMDNWQLSVVHIPEEIMDILEIVQQWLEKHGVLSQVDGCGVSAGETGLFPLGQEQLWLREDVVGNRVRRVRYSFTLKKTAAPGVDAAAWLLQLQELAAKNPPWLGENQKFWAEKGRLVKNTSTGLGIYELRLLAEREEIV